MDNIYLDMSWWTGTQSFQTLNLCTVTRIITASLDISISEPRITIRFFG